jgi:hypothetical protein
MNPGMAATAGKPLPYKGERLLKTGSDHQRVRLPIILHAHDQRAMRPLVRHRLPIESGPQYGRYRGLSVMESVGTGISRVDGVVASRFAEPSWPLEQSVLAVG